MGESGESVGKPSLEAVTGEEAQRIKREALGIGDRRKHHKRAAAPLKGHVKEPDTRHRLYRFRFYPTAEQAEQLAKTFGACRLVYNEGLALRSGAWERHRVNVGFAESCRALTGWKRAEQTAWLGRCRRLCFSSRCGISIRLMAGSSRAPGSIRP